MYNVTDTMQITELTSISFFLPILFDNEPTIIEPRIMPKVEIDVRVAYMLRIFFVWRRSDSSDEVRF